MVRVGCALLENTRPTVSVAARLVPPADTKTVPVPVVSIAPLVSTAVALVLLVFTHAHRALLAGTPPEDLAPVMPAPEESTRRQGPVAAWAAVPAVTHRVLEALRATAVPRGPIPLVLILPAAPAALVEAILLAVAAPV